MKKLLGASFVVVASCQPHAASTVDAAAAASTAATSTTVVAPAAEPKWLASADRAPEELAKRARDVRTSGKFKPKNAADIDAVLDQVASQEASAAGIRAGAKLLADAQTKVADPSFAGSAPTPWSVWLHHGGVALLADLAQRACATKSSKDVLAAIDAIDLPPIGNSGGLDRGRMDEARTALRDAASRCAK